MVVVRAIVPFGKCEPSPSHHDLPACGKITRIVSESSTAWEE